MNTLPLAAIILVLFLAACTQENVIGGDTDEYGCLVSAGYSWCDEKQKCLRVFEENCTAPQLVGNDTDEHGCIPSAGYSWCSEKQKCLRTFEENCTAPVDANKRINVTVGVLYNISSGDLLYIKTREMIVGIELIYSPCPDGARCIWSGIGINLNATRAGRTYKHTFTGPKPESAFPLSWNAFENTILIHETDYKTYALVSVTN